MTGTSVGYSSLNRGQDKDTIRYLMQICHRKICQKPSVEFEREGKNLERLAVKRGCI